MRGMCPLPSFALCCNSRLHAFAKWPSASSAVIAGLLACFLSAAAPAGAPLPRSVLIINQSTALRPWPNAIIAGIRSGLGGEPGAISYYLEHIDLYRFDSPGYADSLRMHFANKYHDKPIGVVIVIGAAGLELVLKLRHSLWPMQPVLFAGVDEATPTQELPPGVTGILTRMTLANMMRAARVIVPDLKRFAIVGDRFQDQLIYRNFAKEVMEFARNLQFIDLLGLSMSDLRRRVAELPDDSVILYIGINTVLEGTYASAAEALPLITEVANRPVIVDVETVFGTGAVGGFLLSPEQIGLDTGHIALRLLNGENAADIPIATGFSLRPIFDWRQLQRWRISEGSLPPGSEIRFRVPSAAEQYGPQILAILAALLLQATVITWLLYERRRRRLAEATTRQTMSDLLHANRMATAGQLSASIAHEVNQPLTGIVANANAGVRWLAAGTPNIERAQMALKQIIAAGHHASDVITSVRSLFKRGAEEGVDVQINQLIRNALSLERIVMERQQISLQLELAKSLPVIFGDRVQLLQVILNLISNAIEAMASSSTRMLRITSREDEGGDILVSIEDTGVGIDKQTVARIFDSLFTTKREGLGMGLSICRSIVENHDGRLWVTSTVGQGSSFSIKLPRYKAGDGPGKSEGRVRESTNRNIREGSIP
jgi:signal transduction histidine kinase